MAKVVRLDHIAFALDDLEQAIVFATEKYGAKFIVRRDDDKQKTKLSSLKGERR
jgi:catechol 2,3-dioxygenase-like lactoylglutathione lyase family enzyme